MAELTWHWTDELEAVGDHDWWMVHLSTDRETALCGASTPLNREPMDIEDVESERQSRYKDPPGWVCQECEDLGHAIVLAQLTS